MAGNLLSAIIAVDIDDDKLELAKKFGAHYTINPKYENVEEKIREITDKNMVDFAIEGSGNPSVVNNALTCLKSRKGRLILMSSYESEAAPFNLKMAMEKSVEVIFPHPGYCDNQAYDMRRAVTALNNEVFKNEEIVSHVFSLNDIQKAFEALENKPVGYLKGIVIP
ncbi:MAG: zinc-binding dehydrogenase [Vallitaleaceae bacterium]|nr:zinc-binding dehydrogenase [Vallitaleaceae bacterium]